MQRPLRKAGVDKLLLETANDTRMNTNLNSKPTKDLSDVLGMALSFLCLFHCLVGPFIVIFLPFVYTAYFYSPWFHFILALFVVPIGAYSFIKGYLKHRKVWLLLLGVCGLVMITALGFLPPYVGRNLAKEVFIVCASSVLICAHLLNYRSR